MAKRVHVQVLSSNDEVVTIGTIAFDGGAIRVESGGSSVHEIAQKPIWAVGQEIDPRKSPELFIYALPRAYSGSRMWVTNVEG